MSSPVSQYSGASDIGLIVQGTLIFLSSVVAVAGYLVQARSKQKQYLREVKLTHLRELLAVIGPVQALGSSGRTLRGSFYTNVVYKGTPLEKSYKQQVEDIYGENALKKICDGDMCEYRRFVSEKHEAEMTANPQGYLAIQYRNFIKILVTEFHRPLCDLVKIQQCSFPLPSREEFKRRFPGHRSGTLRKTFFLWQAAWLSEMEMIIRNEWDKGIFTTWFPVISPFPTHLNSLTSGILTDIKKEIETMTKGGMTAKDNLKDGDGVYISRSAKEKAKIKQKKEEEQQAAAAAAATATVAVGGGTSILQIGKYVSAT